jgi:hypothetical protein
MADPEASQDYISDRISTLEAQTSIGQSFVSRRPNLNGITIWINRVSSSSNATSLTSTNYLTAQFFSSPGSLTPVFTTTLTLPASGTNLPITIAIPDQKNLAGQSYYLVLTNASGTIQVDGRNEDAYPYGQAYINNSPINADIAFRLSYDYGFSSLVSDIADTSASLWLIIPLLIVLWLPGWLLLDLSGLRSRFDLGEQIAIANGVSLALIPVLMLWTTIMKIKWTSQGISFIAGCLIAIFIVRIIYRATLSHKNRSKPISDQSDNLTTSAIRKYGFFTFQSLALILVFLAALAIRFIMVRDLATPAWVDSVHHALITQLILKNGTYPPTYQPYLDISPTAYHAGFHSIAASFTWLSQLDLYRSLLILGQVLNALSVFSVYLFAKTLTRRPNVGLFAAIITGFITPMPSYYASWGRYTELTGLLLLPVILAFIQLLLNETAVKKTGWIIALGAISAGGLFMIHYRVLAFMACMVLVYIIIYPIRKESVAERKTVHWIVLIICMSLLGIISILPWFIQTIQSILFPSLVSVNTASIPPFQDFSWSYLTSAFGKQSLVIAGLGLLWSFLKRQRFGIILVLWVVFTFLLANLAALRLPGGGLINNSSVEIMLFIPISILGGYFIDQLIIHWKALIPPRLIRTSLGVVVLLTGFVSYLGARQLIPILNPITILSRNADLSAIQWVSENIPSDETIVINPFAWGYGLYAGNDGGYWISPLAGQPTLPPPVIYGMSPGSEKINALSQQVISLCADPIAIWEFLHTHRLNYIYIGARGGVISPEILSSSDLFTLIYHQDSVWIFKDKP